LNLLIVVYDFPPYVIGGAVNRTVKYIKYLKKHKDISITVLTSKRLKLSQDESLSKILKDIDIHYVEDPIQNKYDKVKSKILKKKVKKSLFFNIKDMLKKIISNLMFPDFHIIWGYKAYKQAKQIENIDIVYSTFPIASAHFLATLLSIKFHKPLILDYRDLWFKNKIFKKNCRIANYINKYIEKYILNHASYVIFTTEFAKDKYLNENLLHRDKKYSVLWNGIDPQDFIHTKAKNYKDGYLSVNIVYTGGLGNINSSRRTPKFLFNAANTLSNKLMLNIYGDIPADVIEYANKIENIKFYGLIPYSEIASVLNEADILIVILTPDEDLTAVPGKVFEYMYSNKYILALTDKKSQLASLLRTYNFASIVDPFDEVEIYNTLTDIIKHKRYMNIKQTNTKMINEFNRIENTETLYNIIRNTGLK